MDSFAQSSYLLTSFSAFYLLSMRREFFFTTSFLYAILIKTISKNESRMIDKCIPRRTFKKEFITKNIHLQCKKRSESVGK